MTAPDSEDPLVVFTPEATGQSTLAPNWQIWRARIRWRFDESTCYPDPSVWGDRLSAAGLQLEAEADIYTVPCDDYPGCGHVVCGADYEAVVRVPARTSEDAVRFIREVVATIVPPGAAA